MTVKRGDIYYADLSPVVGSEQGGVRPVLIVQNDVGNRFSPTVIAAAITSQKDKTNLPTHIPVLSFGPTSTALCEQITPVDISRVGTYEGKITEDEMRAIDRGLLVSLGIAQ